MSQVFSADATVNTGTTTTNTTTETTAVTGNFLSPPFQNCKALVIASIVVDAGTGTTGLLVKMYRNPSAENFNIAGFNTLAITVGSRATFTFQAADRIPDGRSVQYSITVTQIGATGNGDVAYAQISTMLISG